MAGPTIISGFHSPVEQEALIVLLRGPQPVILCPARSLARMRLKPAYWTALEAGRLLLLSPFAESVHRATIEMAYQRNRFVAALMDARGILKQSGSDVQLRGPKQRKGIRTLSEPDRSGMATSVIDVLHRAAALWEQGTRQELAAFLKQVAYGQEEKLRLVAQTLINILPDDDAERRLLEGFLAGRDVLPEVATQDRLF